MIRIVFEWDLYTDKMDFCEAQLWGAQEARAVLSSEEDMTCNEPVRGHLSFGDGSLHDMTRAE